MKRFISIAETFYRLTTYKTRAKFELYKNCSKTPLAYKNEFNKKNSWQIYTTNFAIEQDNLTNKSKSICKRTLNASVLKSSFLLYIFFIYFNKSIFV